MFVDRILHTFHIWKTGPFYATCSDVLIAYWISAWDQHKYNGVDLKISSYFNANNISELLFNSNFRINTANYLCFLRKKL